MSFLIIWASGVVAVFASGTVILMIRPALQAAFDNKATIPLPIIAFIIVAASLVAGVGQFIQTMLLEKTGLDIVSGLRRDLFNHILKLDVRYLMRNHVGHLAAICMEETALVREITGNLFVRSIQDVFSFLILFGIVIYLDWRLSFIALIAVPVIVFGKSYISKKRRGLMTELLESRAQITARLSETLFNVRLVKIFGTEDLETQRMSRAFEDQAKLHLEALRARSLSLPLNELIIGVCIILVMFIGAWKAQDGVMTLSDLTAILVALISAYRPLKRLDEMGNRIQEGVAAAQRIKSILDLESEIKDSNNARPLVVSRGEIVFENVSFGYLGQEQNFCNLNLLIPGGSTVAIVGPSGAGKSTLVNMIPRFFDPVKGRVLIDGYDVREVLQSSLRSHIAMVTQETLLFDDTVAANIAYGKHDAVRSEKIGRAHV